MKFIVLISRRDCEEAEQVLKQCGAANSDEVCQWTQLFVDSFLMAKEDDSEPKWTTLEKDGDMKLGAETEPCKPDDKEEQILNNLKIASEKLHQVANSLPAVGALVEVFLWPPNAEDADYILFLGSLRRLKDWHNARVTIFDRELNPATEFLHKFLSSDIYISPENIVPASDTLMWRGKLSVCDKIENSCVLVPGVSVCLTDKSHPNLTFPRRPHLGQDTQQGSSSILPGRMLEVLDEVNLASVPAFLKTPYQYKLCFYQKHSYCQVLMTYLMENTKMGLLARLAVYPGGKSDVAVCADVGLSTEAWKESISADIQFAQEPEEELQDNYEFMYFIITTPDPSSTSSSKFEARLCLLQHPYHISGSVVSMIYHQSMVGPQEGEATLEEMDLSGLPILAEEVLRGMLTDLHSLHEQMIHTWIEEKKQSGDSTVVSTEEFSKFLKEMNLTYLERLAEKLPACKGTSPTLTVDLLSRDTASLEKTYDWPERLIQQYLESQKRTLTRIQSSESVPLSSPLQPMEASTTIDIEKFLKFFHPDGTASTELSPIRRRHHNRSHSRSVLSDSASSRQLLWPESKDVSTHDIYYNLDYKKSEKVNNHLNKYQEKYVKDETFSSCRSAVVVFPKCSKKKQTSSDLDLRRSPRKRAPPPLWDDGRGQEPKRRKVRGDRLGTLQEEPPKRRYSLPSMPETGRRSSTTNHQERRSEARNGGAGQPDKNRRESDCGLSGTGETDKRRRESDCGLSTSLAEKKESRSDRHKRRLLDIVESVLIANGLDRKESIFESCSSRLYKVTKLFVMDLPTSRNLKDEMKKIAESQVKQVIEVDRQRQSTSQGARQKKKSV